MGTQMDDDDIICLSGDSDSEDVPPRNIPSKVTVSPIPPQSPRLSARAEVKVETGGEANNISNSLTPSNGIDANNGSRSSGGCSNALINAVEQLMNMRNNPGEGQQQQNSLLQSDVSVNFHFDAFAIFGPENSSMPMEDRLAAFINNVQSLTAEKISLEQKERQANRKFEEANNQLNTANQEIMKLKKHLVDSQSKVNEQTDSLSQLKSEVEKLQKQEGGSKSKLKNITSTLMHLQSKMVQVLEETEVDTVPAIGGASAQSTPLETDCVTGSAAEIVLKESIETFEKDFEAKFSQVEEQDKEIKNELRRTNEMLQRIQASLMEQFQSEASPASSSPQLTYESMDLEDQDANDDQNDPAPTSSRPSSNSTNSGNLNGVPKKVSLQEESQTNHTFMHARDPKKQFACICGVRYRTKYSINRHLRRVTGLEHFTCNICSASFFELCHLRKHYETVHELHYPAKIAGCSGCGKVFNSIEVLSKHRNRCNGRSGADRGTEENPQTLGSTD